MTTQPSSNERDDWQEMRAAFVAIIKEENFMSNGSKWSLRAHWSGPKAGFHDHMLDERYRQFCDGWKAAKRTAVEPRVFPETTCGTCGGTGQVPRAAEPAEAVPEELTERLLAEADLCRNDGATDIAKLLEDAAKQNEVHWRTRRTLLRQLESTAEPPKAEPVAWVPIHPKEGPLWTMTMREENHDVLPHYELMPLYSGSPPKDDHWWCDTCKREVQPDHVTNDETHDIRAGGCGQHVMEERPSTGSPPSAAINELLSYGGHRYVCDYVERGAKCSCGWQELSARVRAGLTKGVE